MNEQNTGPDFSGEDINSKNSINSEAIKALEKKGLHSNIIKKLSELQGEVDSQSIEQAYAEEYPGEDKQSEINQANNWLQEGNKRIEDLAAFERSKLRENLNSPDEGTPTRNSLQGVTQSAKTIASFGIDLGKGAIQAIKNPRESLEYTLARADGKLSQADLEYEIPTQNA